jgi:formylglycine-generating enzyme required for sulfatase activity
VCWWEADAFCLWLTMTREDGFTYRMPDEKEWEAAAAGFEGREYPWGGWAEDRCNTQESKIGKTSSVGVFPGGNTPEGLSDMAGNVWEWTETPYEEGSSTKVLRGGSWDFDRVVAECTDRFRNIPLNRNNDVGFRCVRTK